MASFTKEEVNNVLSEYQKFKDTLTPDMDEDWKMALTYSYLNSLPARSVLIIAANTSSM